MTRVTAAIQTTGAAASVRDSAHAHPAPRAGVRDSPPPSPARAAVAYAGELDLASSVELLQAVRVALRGQPETLAVDLSAVSFIDVAGVRALISCRRMAAVRNAGLELVAPSTPVRRLLGMVGLAEAFGVDGSAA